MDRHHKPVVDPELAKAADIFDQFCAANTLKTILGHFRHLCDILHIKPTNFPNFYPKLKAKLCSWKAEALWNKFDKRAAHKCYNRGKACPNTRVLVIGGGPCGMRAAIECQLLGAKVVVVEKRDRMSRNNVLHLWPFVIQDLRALGAKKFFGKFCAGSIDHISIRQLQCILLKVALIFGVEFHEGVGFESLQEPPEDQTERIGWRAVTSPPDHPVSQYEFDVLIGADGRRNTLEGFKRKEFRGKLAIAITANFINRRTEAEARVEEISGVAFIFNQKFFKDLYAKTGIDLENIVYYKDETHYFVMTAKKTSLIEKGVILIDYPDTAKLLSLDNVNKTALEEYARQAADFSTNYKLPQLEFAVNHYGQADVAMFDFTSMYAAENASRMVEKRGHRLLMTLVGDSLLEPFWPTGSGCARGFLSSMDACWAVRSWGLGNNPLEVIAERESIYRILAQTTPENLQRDVGAYTLDPHTRYPNLNSRCVIPVQVRGLFTSDAPGVVEALLAAPSLAPQEPKKRRKRDTQVHPDTLLHWLKKQVALYDTVHINDMSTSFKDGLALCAIIHRYRPDLVDFHSLQPQDVARNNQLAFDILEKDLGIPPVMTGQEMEECEVPDTLAMLSYLSQIYDTFRGEIPHIKHPKLEESELVKDQNSVAVMNTKLRSLAQLSMSHQRAALLTRLTSPRDRRHTRNSDTTPRRARKRRSDKASPLMRRRLPRIDIGPINEDIPGGCLEHQLERASLADRDECRKELEKLKMERIMRRQYLRHKATQQFHKSMQMLSGNAKSDDEKTPYEDYSIFVYRQTAPDFRDRVKEIEMKILYPDKEQRLLAEVKRGGAKDQDTSERVKHIQDKLKEMAYEKKPKDLHRAIGKIEKCDWNVKEIEKKITENKYGRSSKGRTEPKVPKWSREQYEDKVRKLTKDDGGNSKYQEIEDNLKRIDRKIKEVGSVPEPGKVSAMAAHLANMNQEPEKPVLQKSNSKAALNLPTTGGSEICHFCNKRVYLMERLSAEGKFFHRGCFRCEYCNNILRLGNYAYDRDGKYGSRFFCVHHYGMTRTRREEHVNKENIPSHSTPKTPVLVTQDKDMNDEGATPERIEFENLSGVGETASDHDDAEISEMDEDEWTELNFGPSAAEVSSEEASDLSDSDEEEAYAEALDVDVGVGMTKDETLRLAETWTRRHSHANNMTPAADIDEESGSCHDSDDSRDRFSYQEYDSEDDESDTATEGEEDVKARELRRQEVHLEAPDIETDSDTEVASDEYTSSSESEESSSEEEVENSATEISTDSEFEHDGTTPTQQNIPDIVISESVHVKRGRLEEPRKVQVLNKPLNGKLSETKKDVQLEFTPLIPDRPSLNNINNNNGPTPLINPRRGDYLLNRTHSTEGIASKISLELKKRYLLGPSGLTGNVKKSGSASTLDSRFKSFVDQISEHQKLLNPAPEPSPTMQAFLQGADKIHVSPSITQLARKEKELPGVANFSHICQLKDKEPLVPSNEQDPLCKTNKDSSQLTEISSNEIIKTESKDVSQPVDQGESRPRSPVHETSIVVPDLPQAKKEEEVEEEDIDSDSLSSDSDSSLDDESNHKSQGQMNIPPKVEIHNSRGELMEDGEENEGFIVIAENKPDVADTEEPAALDSLNMVVPDICQHTRPTDFLPNVLFSNRSQVDLVPTKEKESSTFQKIISVPSTSEKLSERGQILKQVPTTAELYVSEDKSTDGKGSGKSSPSSPISIGDDRSFQNESIMAALTETELSDWARDEDVGVSENLEDLEFNINPQYITFRRHQKPRNKRNSRGVAAKIARTEDFDDEFGHVCGRVDKVPQTSNLLVNTDNIEFMDTGGEEESSTDEYLKNSGYVQFVNPTTDDDDDLITPTAETPINCLPEGDFKENAEDGGDTTTSNSEAITIMESPLDAHKDFDVNPVIESPVIESTPTPDLSNKTYEEYVRRQVLQGRISPFSNVRDSIDIRKSRKHSASKTSLSLLSPDKTLKEVKEEKKPVTVEKEKPQTMSEKLEEISKERSKQKDLIHEMVLEKIMVHGKSPQDRKMKRNARNTPSPRLGSQNSIISIPSDKTESSHEADNLSKKLNASPIPNSTPTDNKGHKEENHNENEITPQYGPEVFETPNNNLEEKYFTPMTSFKEQAAKSRPLSMNFSFRLQNSANKNKTLPVTPLTNPEAYSLPDIRKALYESEHEFKTPVPPPRLKALDREQVRESARARAKMLSDEELGLSPEERIKKLKEKVSRRFERSESSPASSHVEPTSMDNNIQISLSRSNESLTIINSRVPEPTSEKKDPEPCRTSSQVSPQPTESSSTPLSNKVELRLDGHGKKSKNRDGRKSIIQVVSSIFQKKSPTSLSPPKSAPAATSSHSKFSKFKLHRSKEKSKSANNSDAEEYDEQKPPVALSKSQSESEARRKLIDESVAPPIPPPPLNYPSSRQHSEDSLSETEEGESHASATVDTNSTRKRNRASRKLERQAHLKRLRMAQEIQRQLEELEVKQRELETRGVELEKAIRAENSSGGGENSGLLREWFELMRERSELRRYERELLVRRQEMELEDRHALLQHELRLSLAKDDKTKTTEEVASEGRILREMLEIVERRDSLITQLEEDRQRYQEEDKDLEAEMLSKGLRLTSLRRKESAI